MDKARALLPTISARLPSTWKLLALIFALINYKSLPFVWHLRLLYGLIRQILTSRHRLTHHTPTNPARPLFAPLIITSRSPPLECDYNLHKSNSTYFSDSDVGRLHVMIATIGKGVDVTRRELEAEDRLLAARGEKRLGGGGGFGVRLGGVSANFRKEIRPFEKFEIWTRVLAWDQKWFYLVQHFVRPGAVRPGGYLFQPWRKVWRGRKRESERADGEGGVEASSAPPPPGGATNPAHSSPIFASVIAKYVFKKGRLTIPPERVLRASQLLPPRPQSVGGEELTPPASVTPSTDNASTVDAAAVSAVEKLTPTSAEAIIDASIRAESGVDQSEFWDWARVEKERVRGMRIAEVYSKLDGLNDEFWGDGAEVLGRY